MKAVDLFCGGGLVTHSLRKLGFDVVCGVENDPAMANVYASHVDNDLIIDHVLSDNAIRRVTDHKPDLIWASPPCTSFSNAKGTRPRQHHVCELSVNAAEIISDIRPAVGIIENSRLIIGSDYFKRMIKILQEAGYATQCPIVDASGLGSPAYRTRAFIVATRFRMDKIKDVEPCTVYSGPPWIDETLPMETSIDIRSFHAASEYDKVKEKSEWHTYQYFSGKPFRHISQTLFAMRTRYGSTIVAKDSMSRPMSPHECLTVMGAHDMNPSGTRNAVFKAAGNGVDVRASTYIINHIY